MYNDALAIEDSSNSQDSAPPKPSTRTRPTGFLPQPLHILLAHPHCLFSQGLAAFLAAQPEVESLTRVSDGQSAWKVIRTRRPDIALLDPGLDKLGETEIMRRIHAKGIATRCFIFEMDTEGDGCASPPADTAGRLSKDSGFEELMHVLRDGDAQERVERPPVPPPADAATAEGAGSLPLSAREREVLRRIVAGETNKTIARALGVSPATVHTHRRRLMTKLGVHSAAELVRYAARNGLLD
jgi:DNA-binding NarL/FixJ family response regulator